MNHWLNLGMIALGGALGSVLRYSVSGYAQRISTVFPLGTLTVNLVGCLVIGLLGGLSAAHFGRDEVRIGLMVGLVGGFTTFSAFGHETLRLLDEGRWELAAGNVLLNNVFGLLAVWLGARATQAWS